MLSNYFLIFIVSAVLNFRKVSSYDSFQVQHQWQFINFTWPSQAEYQVAYYTRKYVPENVVMAGIKIFEGNIYFAIPRIRQGVPVTLGFMAETSPRTNPLINPFPSWDMNYQDHCGTLQSVQSMEIDKNGIMWVLDGFRINDNSMGCPPKIILINVRNSETVQEYTLPEEISLSRGGFLNDIVVDDTNGGFAYITDNSPIDPGLIIYSRSQNRAWKVRDASMFAELDAANFAVDGLNFTNLSPIDGIALSPPNQNGIRSVFYCSLTGVHVYSIRTEILKNEQLCRTERWRWGVTYFGTKSAPSDGLIIDNQGDLYYGLLPLYAVGKWNVRKRSSSEEIVGQDRSTMIWNDSFGFDNQGYLYLLANNIHKFFNTNFVFPDPAAIKFRILKLYTGTASYLYY